MLTILAVLAGILAIPAALDLIRRADLRRIGVRNAVRRPTETLLIVLGSALGTAIIAAALMVGDTFDHSIRDIARTDLGEIDVIFELDDPNDADRALALVEAADVAGTDGALSLRTTVVAVAGPPGLVESERAVEPSVRVSSIDFAAAARFGSGPGDPALSAVARAPASGEIVINADLADDLDVGVGDTVSVFAYGSERAFDVISVVAGEGLGGFSGAYVNPGVMSVASSTAASPQALLVVSNVGGVYDSTDNTDQVIDDVTSALTAGDVGATSNDSKRSLLEDAELEGEELTRIFSVVGGFSVLAGVLLLINLFVMLAEERKPNLGVLRAIGWKRSALRRAFRAEGLLYSVTAAGIGAALGIGVGWVIVQLTRGILQGQNPDSDFVLLFAVRGGSLLTAALVGLIIAMGAIWLTSWRISRLNIISAIRDLPEPKSRRSRLISLASGAMLIVVGGASLAAGLASNGVFLAVLGVPIAIGGAALIAKNFMAPTSVGGLAGLRTVVWGSAFFPVMPSEMTRDVDIAFFLVFGVVVVAGGVAITTVSGPWLERLVARGDRPMVEARVAMAYPSARLFRTATSLAMYSLIIFSLAFMAVLANGLGNQAEGFAEGTAAGHDILVQSNGANPIDAGALASVDGVATSSPVLVDWIQWFADFKPGSENDPEFWRTSAVEPDFVMVGAPALTDRAERFATDAEALDAVTRDASLIIVPSWFLGDEDGVDPEIGSTITGLSARGQTDFELVGVLDDDYSFSGAWVSVDALQRLSPDAAPTRHYVAVEPGVDGRQVADSIEAMFIVNGAEAETFLGRVQRFVEADLGFFSLLQGYLLLGLVIGIAGLAVTLFRAVHERRRQIGMMRAMGMPIAGVRRWFLTEATFVSLMGIVTGVGLGILTSYLVATRSSAFDDDQLPFGIPWATILFILVLPFAASALAAIVPARRAARLLPSEALRLAD